MKPIEEIKVQLSIPTRRYRTDAGDPTCARDFQSGEICPFLACFPSNPCGKCNLVASVADNKPLWYIAFVDTGESGFLVPHKDYPLWSDAQ